MTPTIAEIKARLAALNPNDPAVEVLTLLVAYLEGVTVVMRVGRAEPQEDAYEEPGKEKWCDGCRRLIIGGLCEC